MKFKIVETVKVRMQDINGSSFIVLLTIEPINFWIHSSIINGEHVKNQTCDSPMDELQKWNHNLGMRTYPIPYSL